MPDFESETPSSVPALTPIWICNTVIPSFNTSPTLVNRERDSLPPGGTFYRFKLDLQYLCLCIQCPQLEQQCYIHLNKVVFYLFLICIDLRKAAVLRCLFYLFQHCLQSL